MKFEPKNSKKWLVPTKLISFLHLFWSLHCKTFFILQVSDLLTVLTFLEAQDPKDKETWRSRFVLLLWLSIVVIIPFHMSRLDGFAPGQPGIFLFMICKFTIEKLPFVYDLCIYSETLSIGQKRYSHISTILY